MFLRQMTYFVAVVKYNSFTEAAEQCYISQSAISQQINALEKELGVKLLQRKNRTFHLTLAGDYFYQHCQTILEEIDRFTNETRRIGEEDAEEHLRVGYLKWYGGSELQNAIADFSELYPEVSLSVVNSNHESLYHLLLSGEVDLVLSDQRRAFSNDYVNHHLLYSDCYVEISNRNPLSNQETVTANQLKQTPCIIVASKDQRENEQEFYRYTLGFNGSFLFVESLEEGRLMVINNRGFMPIESVGSVSQHNLSIQRIPLYKGKEQLKRNYCAFWSKDKSNYYIEEFTAILDKHLY